MNEAMGLEEGKSSWLEEVFRRGHEEGWCMSPACTTCGAWIFRVAVFRRAAAGVGVRMIDEDGLSLHEQLSSLSPIQTGAVFEELVIGLRSVGSEWRGADALRTVLMDVHPPLFRLGIPESLDERLLGTPAGAELEAMIAHHDAIQRESPARRAKQEREDTAERRAKRLTEVGARHDSRILEGRERADKRAALLQELRALDDIDRMRWISARPSGFPLEMIPRELIPEDVDPGLLPRDVREKLVALIGKRRKHWGRLRERFIGLEPSEGES